MDEATAAANKGPLSATNAAQALSGQESPDSVAAQTPITAVTAAFLKSFESIRRAARDKPKSNEIKSSFKMWNSYTLFTCLRLQIYPVIHECYKSHPKNIEKIRKRPFKITTTSWLVFQADAPKISIHPTLEQQLPSTRKSKLFGWALPDGFPQTVHQNYLKFTMWTMVQGITSSFIGGNNKKRL